MSNDTTNPEVLEGARQLVISGMSFQEVVDKSEMLLGQKVSLDRIKRESSLHPDLWVVARRGPESRSDIATEVDTIRHLMFETIVASSQEGIWIPIINKDNETTIMRLIRSIEAELVSYGCGEIRRIKPKGLDHNLVNAYMGLLSKSNVNLDIGASAKTSREQAMDIVAEALDESD